MNGTRIKAGATSTCLNIGDIICFGSKVPKNELRYTFHCEVEGSGMASLQKITVSAVRLQNLAIPPQSSSRDADDEGEVTPPIVKAPKSIVKLNPSARKRLKLDPVEAHDLTPPAVSESVSYRPSSLTPPVKQSDHHPVGSTACTSKAKRILPFHAGPSLTSNSDSPLSTASPKAHQESFHVGPSLSSSPRVVCSVSTPSQVSSRIVCSASTPSVSSAHAVGSVTSPVRGARSSNFPGSPPKGQTISFHAGPSALASPLRNSEASSKVESGTSPKTAPFHAGPSALASPLRNSEASIVIVGSDTPPKAVPFHASPLALSSPLRTNCCVTAVNVTTSHTTPFNTGLTSLPEANCVTAASVTSPKAVSFHVGPSALVSPSCMPSSSTVQRPSAVSTSHSILTPQGSSSVPTTISPEAQVVPEPLLTNVTASLSPPSYSGTPLDVTLVPSDGIEQPLPQLANDDSVIIVSPPPVLPQTTAGSSHTEASDMPVASGSAVVQSSPLFVPVSATVKPSPALSAASRSTEVELDDLFEELSNSNDAMLDEAMFGATSSPNALPGPVHSALDGATIQVMAVQGQMEQERLKLMSNIEALKSELAAKNELISQREQDDKETGMVSSMKEEFMCVICQELFINAHTLPCAHSFCKYCITEWMKRKNVCPICRKNIYSSKPVHSLVLDNAIAKIELNMNAQEKQERMTVRNERKGPVSHGVTAKAPAVRAPAVVSIPTSSGASSSISGSGSSASTSTEVITLDDSDDDSDISSTSSDEELYSISGSSDEVCVIGFPRSYGRCFHCGK